MVINDIMWLIIMEWKKNNFYIVIDGVRAVGNEKDNVCERNEKDSEEGGENNSSGVGFDGGLRKCLTKR